MSSDDLEALSRNLLDSLRKARAWHFAVEQRDPPDDIRAEVEGLRNSQMEPARIDNFDPAEVDAKCKEKLRGAYSTLDPRLRGTGPVDQRKIEHAVGYEDPLRPATRLARRNLNFVSGTILMVLTANEFEPTALMVPKIAGVNAPLGLGLATALLGVLAFHGVSYWLYSRADLETHKKARENLSATLGCIRENAKEADSDKYTFLNGDRKQLLGAWLASAAAEVERVEALARMGVHRGVFDFLVPLVLVAAAVVSLLVGAARYEPPSEVAACECSQVTTVSPAPLGSANGGGRASPHEQP